MVKVVIGGQMDKPEIEKKLQELTQGKDVNFEIKSDLDAAMAVQSGEADYYIGACQTGAGGALAMATALLGANKTQTVATPTKVMSEEEIKKSIDDGKVAFGFTSNTENTVLPILAKYLFN